MDKPVKNLNINEIINILKSESEKGHCDIIKIENPVVALLVDMPVGSYFAKYYNTKRFNFYKNLVFKSKESVNIANLIALGKADIPTLDFKEIENVVKKSKNPYWAVDFLKSFPHLKTNEYEKIIAKSKNSASCAEFLVNFKATNNDMLNIILSEGSRPSLIKIFKLANISIDKEHIGKIYIDSYFDEKYCYLPDARYPKISVDEIKGNFVKFVRETSNDVINHAEKAKLLIHLFKYLDGRVRDYELTKMEKSHNLKFKAM